MSPRKLSIGQTLEKYKESAKRAKEWIYHKNILGKSCKFIAKGKKKIYETEQKQSTCEQLDLDSQGWE